MVVKDKEMVEETIRKSGMEISKDRCYFCGGNISSRMCIMCGRSTNIRHELYVMGEQRKPHHNWHTNLSDVQKASRGRRGNPDGYGRRREE